MTNKSTNKNAEIMSKVKNWLSNNSDGYRLVDIKPVYTKVNKSNLTSIKNKNDKTGLVSIKEVEYDKKKLTSIKDKNDKTGLVSIKDRYDKSNLVSIKDRNDKSNLVSIKEKNTKPKVTQYNDGIATIDDGRGNTYEVYMADKVKSPKWQLTQVNDGIATIKYADGSYDDINIRGNDRSRTRRR